MWRGSLLWKLLHVVIYFIPAFRICNFDILLVHEMDVGDEVIIFLLQFWLHYMQFKDTELFMWTGVVRFFQFFPRGILLVIFYCLSHSCLQIRGCNVWPFGMCIGGRVACHFVVEITCTYVIFYANWSIVPC